MPAELRAIEESGIFANNGPTVRRLERAMTETLFGGVGGVVTTANATLGLMLAMKQAANGRPAIRRLALMPSFTFAATAQAAIWAGFKPLLCDIDPQSWTACPKAEEALLKRYGQRIGLIVPCATFGTDIDFDRYAALSRLHDVGIVVDAAACLGSRLPNGRNIGAGSRFAVVYSMHATKTFASGEGGVVHCAGKQRLATLRSMASFGFSGARSAIMPGLNAKLSEIGALLALGKLREIDAVVAHRAALAALYRAELEDFPTQVPMAGSQALQFMSVLLPAHLAARRPGIMASMAAQGIGTGAYFSPHLAQQPYFAAAAQAGPLPVTTDIAARILTLPLWDVMTASDVFRVTTALREACVTPLDLPPTLPQPWQDMPVLPVVHTA